MVAGSLTYDTKMDTKGIENGLESIGKTATIGLAGALASVTALSVAFGKLVKDSVSARGELEQQIGGVQTLFANEFGDASETVINNANKAYRTAGMSAIDYMQNVTSFSASLLQSLGGDTAKAAEYSDRAIKDMSDNANKMGTDIAMITATYQSLARGNYVMLDNLKLG